MICESTHPCIFYISVLSGCSFFYSISSKDYNNLKEDTLIVNPSFFDVLKWYRRGILVENGLIPLLDDVL